ncbi:efflux RND transporter periplasmic adaptor subunit [Thiotrichales bacterium 19S11-10]|nr:efflux RND transporter periplasmic adaptor subunit [Thiotrichales bacterium 19S11-10]
MVRKKRTLIIVIAIIIVSSLGLYIYKKETSTNPINQIPPTAEVKLIALERVSSPEIYNTYGSVVAPNSVDLKSQVTGVVQTIDFINGQKVKKGDTLFTIDDADALSQLQSAQASLDQLTADYQRYETLYNNAQAVSKEEVDNFKAQYLAALANFNSAKANFEHTTVKAPFDGKTAVSEVAIGSYVDSGSALVTLVDRKDLEIEYALPETLLGEVKMDQIVEIRSDAYPNQVFKAKVNYISPDVSTDSLTFNVRAKYTNKNDLLSPGMNVDIKHILNTDAKAILIPISAVVLLNDSYYAFEVIDGKSKAIPIKIGLVSNNGEYIVLSGIKAGQSVIHDASNILDGMVVKVANK